MKCPHCGYKSGWDNETYKSIEGERGKFYSLPLQMERSKFHDLDREPLYGCPSCGKVFMEV